MSPRNLTIYSIPSNELITLRLEHAISSNPANKLLKTGMPRKKAGKFP